MFNGLPPRYLPIFISEALGKQEKFASLKESQMPVAFSNIITRINTEGKEFVAQLSSGREIDSKYAK